MPPKLNIFMLYRVCLCYTECLELCGNVIATVIYHPDHYLRLQLILPTSKDKLLVYISLSVNKNSPKLDPVVNKPLALN